MLTIGIDPGAKTVGLALFTGREWQAGADIDVDIGGGPVIDARDDGTQVLLRAVCDQMSTWSAAHREAGAVEMIAIEQTIAPQSHHYGRRQLINVAPVIATAFVEGVLIGRLPTSLPHYPLIVRVAPAHFGHRQYSTYPPALISNSERRAPKFSRSNYAGQGKLRHQRAAHDIALRALTDRKLRERHGFRSPPSAR